MGSFLGARWDAFPGWSFPERGVPVLMHHRIEPLLNNNCENITFPRTLHVSGNKRRQPTSCPGSRHPTPAYISGSLLQVVYFLGFLYRIWVVFCDIQARISQLVSYLSPWNPSTAMSGCLSSTGNEGRLRIDNYTNYMKDRKKIMRLSLLGYTFNWQIQLFLFSFDRYFSDYISEKKKKNPILS